jgi:spore germination protein KA
VFIALTLPGLYVAVTTYHQEMIPTNLLFSIASSREAIPFPAFIEALIMEISFEALREAGVRLPKIVGQAVSILGALVIGQAAVEAGIVSAPMVIVVSLTGIASFTIPRFNMAISIRLLRFPFIFLAGMFGLFGIVLGILIILTHLSKLRSFGIPYLSPVSPLSNEGQKDVLLRAPWWSMNKRPNQMVKDDRTREGEDLMPSPGKGSEEGNPT